MTQPACLQNNGASCEHETEQSQLGHMGTEPLTLGSLAPFINQGSPRVNQLVVHLAGGVTCADLVQPGKVYQKDRVSAVKSKTHLLPFFMLKHLAHFKIRIILCVLQARFLIH